MKKLLIIFTTLSVCFAPIAHADQLMKAKSQPIEEKILADLKKGNPAISVTSVRKSEVIGLYEVTMGNNIAYTDANAKYRNCFVADKTD